MRIILGLSLSGLALALSACTGRPPAVPDRDGLRPHIITNSARQEPEKISPRSVSTTGTLTLDAAIETALLNNPSLRADFAAFEAAALEVPQASSLMDPRVTYTQFVEGVQTRTGEQQFIAGVTQMFPWFGKLRLQGEIAHSRAMQVLQVYLSRMLDVREQVQEKWIQLAYEESSFALAVEDKRIIEQSVEAASVLYGAGQRGRGALLQSQTELARIENELTGYPARIAALREELARLLYLEELGDVPPLDATLTRDFILPSADNLIADAIALRPEIERYRLGEKQAASRHDLARRDYYPDITLGLNYIGIGDRPDNPRGAMAPPDEGEDAWGVTVGLNIPIPNARRRAARDQALRQGEEAEWRRIAAESSAREEVSGLLPRLSSLEQQLAVLANSLIPLAEEAYVTNQTAYSSGEATFLDLLDAQRTLIAIRRDHLRTRRDYLLAITGLERAVGGSISLGEHP